MKRAIKEEGEGGGAAAPLAEPEEVPLPLPPEPEEVLPPPPEEVPPPPPEEVKRCKVLPPLRAPKVNFEDVCFQ
jgi:hypothetical protein